MSKKKTVLILDGNNMLHRGYHAMNNLSHMGKPTGAIFGFLQILSSAVIRFKPSKIISCFDNGRHKERLKILPTYKARETDRVDFDYKDFQRQLKMVLRMLRNLGIPSLYGEGMEADDYIFAMTKKYEAKGYRVIICSGDKDFRQLVNKKIHIFDNNKGLITPINFKQLFVIEPEQYGDYLCLDGDSSDKIPGVKGIGPKKAIALLKDHGSIQHFLGNGKNANHPKYVEIREVYYVNRVLIKLDVFWQLHNDKIPLQYYKDLKNPKRRLEKYSELCSQCGINKFKSKDFIESLP